MANETYADKDKMGDYARNLHTKFERSREAAIENAATKKEVAVGEPRLFPGQERGLETRIPKQIIIEPTSRCNLACMGCPIFRETGYPPGDMDLNYFKSIVDRVVAEGLDDTTLVLFFNGEPLIHPQYYEMVKYVIDRDVKCYITTNGTIWNEDLFNLIMQPNSCYQLIVSIDGLFEEWSNSIEIARPGTVRKVLKRNIDRLIDMRDAYADWIPQDGDNDPRRHANIDLAIKSVHRGQDYQEIERMVDYWLRRGVSYVCIGKMLGESTHPKGRIYPCRYFDDMFLCVRWDGRVVACAYNEEMSNKDAAQLGHLDYTTSLVEFYNNERYRHLRLDQEAGKFHAPCDTCSFNYTGMGFDGAVKFRDPNLLKDEISYHSGYYNEFFSLHRKREGSNFKYEREVTRRYEDVEAVNSAADA